MVCKPHSLISPAGGGARAITNYMRQRDNKEYLAGVDADKQFADQNEMTEYYRQHGSIEQVEGVWFGEGCRGFGLIPGEQADNAAVENMLQGYDPEGDIFTQKEPEEDHRAGLEVCLTPPKDFSVMIARRKPEEREQLFKIRDEAIRKTIEHMERRGLVTIRKGAGGKNVEAVKPVCVAYHHATSREGDMNWHTHLAILNAAKDAEGNGYRTETKRVWDTQKELGAVFRAEISRGLQEQFGTVLERADTSWSIAGVDAEVRRHFSKRRNAIEKLAGAGASGRQTEIANLHLRQDKIYRSQEEADMLWQDDLGMFGMDHAEGQRILRGEGIEAKAHKKPSFDLDYILDKLCLQNPYFREDDLYRIVAQEADGVAGMGSDEIMAKAEHALTSKRLVKVYAKENGQGPQPWMITKDGFDALPSEQQFSARASYERWVSGQAELVEETGITKKGQAWMMGEGGFEALSEKLQAKAQKSYDGWMAVNQERVESSGKEPWSLKEYVTYVQEKWAEKQQVGSGKEPRSLEEYVSFVQKHWTPERLAESHAKRLGRPIGWTFRETLHIDFQLQNYSKAHIDKTDHKLLKELVDRVVAEYEAEKKAENPKFEISPKQRLAIYFMTIGGDLAMIEGVAGAGKSTILEPVARCYQEAGYDVLGTSYKNVNAAGLRKEGIVNNSHTIDSLISQLESDKLKFTDKTIVLLDEFSEVGGLKQWQIVRNIQAAGAKLITVGHEAQTQAINGDSAQRCMYDAVGGVEGGKVFYLDETMRQRDENYGKALTELSEGKATKALVMHAEAGKLHIVKGDGVKDSAALYFQKVEEVGIERAFLLSYTNASMRNANDEIRQQLKEAGVIAKQDYNVILTASDGLAEYESQLSVGDRIITRGKDRQNEEIVNGLQWIIKDIDEVEAGRLKIKIQSDSEPDGPIYSIDTAKFDKFHLAYAMTSTLSQGKTKEDSANLFENIDQISSYLTTSRSKMISDIIVPEYVINDLAARQDKTVTMHGAANDPENQRMDVNEAAGIIKQAVENMGGRKSYAAEYRREETYKYTPEADNKDMQALEQRELHRMKQGFKTAEVALAERQAQREARSQRMNLTAKGKAEAHQLPEHVTHDGRVADETKRTGKKTLAELAGLTKTEAERLQMGQAFRQVGTDADPHVIRAKQRAAEKEAEAGKKKELDAAGKAMRKAESDLRGGKDLSPDERQALSDKVHEARDQRRLLLANNSQRKAFEARCNKIDTEGRKPLLPDPMATAAEKADRAAREQARQAEQADRAAREIAKDRGIKLVDDAESYWRALPADAPATKIVFADQERQERREAYRGLLTTDAERQAWDLRNTKIDTVDASTPASKRMVEMDEKRAAEEQARIAEEARRKAEQARQQGRGRSM